ncbi:EamA family transporter [Pseudacidovorax intermedius]|uniref:EamA domain-containing protein n=1 Tax=Pseudacidovorax intermedius TaxID=433924 RepID=A0A147GLK5_9BURK|nr:EamA family transporter [Pseudacidovorax intermedius]KTT14469.1 hypothetical protein NS331_23735 [Pseudacidovorax intermedius]
MGALLVLLSALGFGAMALFAHVLYAQGMDTHSLLTLRFALAAVLLGGLAWARGARFPAGRALADAMLMGLAYALMAWTYFSALRHASSATVALLLYVYPVLVAVAAAALRLDRFGAAEALCLGLASAGLCLVLGGAIAGTATGLLLALASALCYSAYILLGSRAQPPVDSLAASTVVLGTAAACYLGLAMWQGMRWPQGASGWGAMLALAIFGTVVAIVAFVAGLRRVGPTQAAVLSTLEPVVTVGLGVAFLGERLSPGAAAGGALILLAALALTVARSRRARAGRGVVGATVPDAS